MTETELKYLNQVAKELNQRYEYLTNESNKIQTEATKVNTQLKKLNTLLNQYQKEPTLVINIRDYLTEEQFQDYLNSINEPEMLCEFDIPFREWLDWFYEELPFLQSQKHLIIQNGFTIDELIDDWIIRVDHINKSIYLDNGLGTLLINLDGIDLYYLLNVKYQRDWEDYMVSNYEYE